MHRIHFGHPLSSTKSPCEKTLAGYLKKNSNMVAHREPHSRFPARLVRHAIHDVIEPHAKSHRCESLWISWIVGPLPGVAQVHVVADRDHDAPLVVADRPPLRDVSVFFIRPPRPHILFPRDWKTSADVVQPVENFVLIGQFLDGT